MLFNSFAFLFFFLPISVTLYYIVPTRMLKALFLIVVSVLFYCWNNYKLILIFGIEGLFTYLVALIIQKIDTKVRQFVLPIAILFVVGILFYFKYAIFFFSIINIDFSVNHSLPLGLSFYTFNMISYLVDVYKNKIEAEKNPIYLAAYLLFFPFVLSGPLQRYGYIKDQLEKIRFSSLNISNGIRRFVIGLGKKVILANNIAIISDYIFNEIQYTEYTSGICWFGAFTFTLQIFFDFSGYSDMAIGIANMFGIKSEENFNYPYMANSITDFWRRWHISLSTWFRDYIYIPLGGNRVSKIRQYFNLLVVWLLTGLWHGAAWNYIIWGLYFFAILVIEKRFLSKFLSKAYVLRNIYSLLIVIVGWVIFNSTSFNQIAIFLKTMFGSLPVINLEMIDGLGFLYLMPYVTIAVVLSFDWIKKLFDILNSYSITGVVCDVLILCIFIVCIAFMINESYSPFLYFQY